MSAMQRSKGQRGERELFGLLSDELGFVIQRNIDQTRAGGADCIQVPGWALECKRCETLNINAWWKQAVKQAEDIECMPMLLYRQSRKPWRAVVALWQITSIANGELHHAYDDHMVEISFETACYLIRESFE